MKITILMSIAVFITLGCSLRSQIENTVKIGEQEWMVKNLNVSKFRNGDIIPEAKSREDWKKAGNENQPAWCYYDNDPVNEANYGKLYNWYAVSDPRGITPEGWHVPSDDEWQILIDYLGGEKVAGGKMKESVSKLWKHPNKGATNQFGLTVFGGGVRYIEGKFNDLDDDAYFWSSTEYDATHAWYRILGYSFSNVYKYYYDKRYGFSVRCIKD